MFYFGILKVKMNYASQHEVFSDPDDEFYEEVLNFETDFRINVSQSNISVFANDDDEIGQIADNSSVIDIEINVEIDEPNIQDYYSDQGA